MILKNLKNKISQIDPFIVLVFFLLSIFKVISSDVFWHLRIGEIFFNEFSIVNTNRFSWIYPTIHWHSTYWLFSVLTYFIYSLGGFHVLVIVKSACISIFYGILPLWFDEKRQNVLISTIIMLAIFELSFFRFIVRPHIVTYFMMIVLIIYLNQLKKGNLFCRKHILIISLIFIFWVQFHSGVIFGVVYFCVILSEYFLSDCFHSKQKIRFVAKYFILVCFILLILCLNPSKWTLYGYLFDHMGIEQIIQLEEFMSLNPAKHFKYHIIYWTFILSSLIVFLFRKKLSLKHCLLFMCSLFLFHKGVRFLPLSVLFLLEPIKESLFDHDDLFKGIKLFKYQKIISFLVIIYYCSHMFVHVYTKDSPYQLGLGVNRTIFPYDGLNKIKNMSNLKLFNSFSIGGFIIWESKEKIKVFQDGRIHAYPLDFIKAVQQAKYDFKKWTKMIEQYQINCCFFSKDETPQYLIDHMKKLSSWELILDDDISALFRRINV